VPAALRADFLRDRLDAAPGAKQIMAVQNTPARIA
jgi:hypothetical protein